MATDSAPYWNEGGLPVRGLKEDPLDAKEIPVFGKRSPITDRQEVDAFLSGAVTITGEVEVKNDTGNPIPVTGPLTDTQLRVAPVPVSGTVTTGGLTDTQLRAAPVPVSGPVTDANLDEKFGDLGQKTMAGSAPVVLASDQPALPISLAGLPTSANSQVSVGTSQVAIPTANLAARKTISVKALAANGAAVYIGLTGVSSTTGYELSAGDAVEIDADATVNLFAISASGTQRVSILEVA